MFTNFGLTVEMYFKYILKRMWVLGSIFLVSHIGTEKKNMKIFK